MADSNDSNQRPLPSSLKRFLTVTDADGTTLNRPPSNAPLPPPPPPPSALVNRLQAFLPQLAAANAQLAAQDPQSVPAGHDLIEKLDAPPLPPAPLLNERATRRQNGSSPHVDPASKLVPTDEHDNAPEEGDTNATSDDDEAERSDDSSVSDEDVDDASSNPGQHGVEMVLMVDNTFGQLVPDVDTPANETEEQPRRPLIVELPESKPTNSAKSPQDDSDEPS